jgi:hypothetical protein
MFLDKVLHSVFPAAFCGDMKLYLICGTIEVTPENSTTEAQNFHYEKLDVAFLWGVGVRVIINNEQTSCTHCIYISITETSSTIDLMLFSSPECNIIL